MPARSTARRNGPAIVELAGPAGAGKTTLSRALLQSSEKIVAGADISLRKAGSVPIFVQNAVALLPVFLCPCPTGRWFTWDEIKSMVYLKGWSCVFKEQAAQKAIVILDHGPIFRLATLRAFGPERLRKRAAEQWWNDMFEQWASLLDVVIWLDAPDALLGRRIDARSQRHRVKGKTQTEVSEFLARYRRGYAHVLAQLAVHGGPRLVQFDTSETALEQVVDRFLAICSEQGSQ